MIWQRTVATQMADARFNQVGIDIEALAQDPRRRDVRYGLRATGQTLVFDGFIRIYKEGRDDAADADAESTLPELTAEQALRMLEVLPEQHFTQPPPRFSEASLVKTLEELGIGRPSTYASTISTIQDRGYVRLEDKRFYPEDVGMVVTDKLIEHFPDVVDVNFTAHMEEELDDIAEGGIEWTQVLHEFNGPFERALEKAEHSFERYEEELDELCPLCPKEGREPGKLQVKLGRFGKFIGCPNYPECRYIRNMDGSERPEPVLLDETCPECGVHKLQERVGRFGPFVGCSGYPECRYIRKDPPVTTGVTCPAVHTGRAGREARTGSARRSTAATAIRSATFAVSNPPIKDHPCPRVRFAAAAAAEERQVLELRRRAGPGLPGHEGRRRRGRGRGPRGQGGRARGARPRRRRSRRPRRPRRRRPPPSGRPRRSANRRQAEAAPRRRRRAAAAATLAAVPDAPEA